MRFLADLRTPTEKLPHGYSKNTLRLVRNVGRMLCEDAIDDGWLTENPFQFRKSRRKQPGKLTRRDRTKQVRAMDEDQLARFLAAAREHEPRLYPMFLLMARTGLRPGETLALRWEDFDPTGTILHIRRSLSLGEEGPTKTENERDVHVSPELALTLRRLRAERESQAREHEWVEVPARMFCTTARTAYDPANVLKAMRRALVRAKLPPFRVYDLRHTFATSLLNRGVPITYVSAQLGHADAATTLIWYAHFLPKAAARYVDLLDAPSTMARSQSLAPRLAPDPANNREDDALTTEEPDVAVSAPRVIRTPDLLIRSQTLYPTELWAREGASSYQTERGSQLADGQPTLANRVSRTDSRAFSRSTQARTRGRRSRRLPSSAVSSSHTKIA